MRKPPKDGFFKRNKKRCWLFFLFLMLIGLVYFFIYSPVFKIKKVVVGGTSKMELIGRLQIIAKDELSERKWLILPNNNYFILNEKSLFLEMNDRLVLDELAVNKKLLHTLKIHAKEKIPVLLLEEGGENYYIDKEGLVLRAIKLEEIEYILPRATYSTSTQVIVGRNVISGDNIEFIDKVFESLDSEFNSWKLDRVVFTEFKNSQLAFYTNEGWYFILNTELTVDRQVDNLEALLDQKIEDRGELEYIDLRIEDRVFYK